jgi:hypothetical protein
MDVDARIQLFDLKKKYAFQTTPGVDKYNMPLYDFQTEGSVNTQSIGMYPVYQGFVGPAYINGVPISFTTQKNVFRNLYPNITQNLSVIGVGDGGQTYNLKIPLLANTAPINPPVSAILRGHVDIAGIIATGNNVDPPLGTTLDMSIASTSIDAAVYLTTSDSTGANMIVTDSGTMLSSNVNYGLLMSPGNAPFGYSTLGSYDESTNTINYLTGDINVTFPSAVPSGVNINAQVYYFQAGLPRAVLFYDNTLTLRAPPSQQWLVELDAYLSPSAFLITEAALPYAYMAEYFARGAARKILSDTGDIEQFQFYEPLFKEQETLVWKRSQRQFTSTRTETIFSLGWGAGSQNNYLGQGSL